MSVFFLSTKILSIRVRQDPARSLLRNASLKWPFLFISILLVFFLGRRENAPHTCLLENVFEVHCSRFSPTGLMIFPEIAFTDRDVGDMRHRNDERNRNENPVFSRHA